MSKLPPPSVTAGLMYEALMMLVQYAAMSVEEPEWLKNECVDLHIRMEDAWRKAQEEDEHVN